MNLRLFILAAVMLVATAGSTAAAADESYKQTEEYKALRDSVHHAFNRSDSTKFFVAVARLEDYLLKQNDLHAYYTQRCNEIVFQLNRERIFEAYKLATKLSQELTDRKLDKEMYMAVNMMGHIYNYCGRKESAKRCFWEVIDRMEKEGYKESQPPIYMNLVNILMDEDPDSALHLIDKAVAISHSKSPERTFDIETRRALGYYSKGDMKRFLEGYKAYKAGEAQGFSSVHGRALEVYYLAQQGKVDEAVQLAMAELDSRYSTASRLYADAGRWKEAYDMLKLDMAETDSINSLILSNSMQGIQDELLLYEAEREQARLRLFAISAIAALLLALVVALVYIVQNRRRHLREMRKAYERVQESDRLKTAFIQNVSHEVRTPLNIISGFAQVLVNPDFAITYEKRRQMAEAMSKNTHLVTTMIGEVLELSASETSALDERDLTMERCNHTLWHIASDYVKDAALPSNVLSYESSLPDDFQILTHKILLQRIISPLLDNAAKNSSGTPIVMRATVEDNELLISVEDQGKGVPAAEAEHIFERFVKLDTFKEGLGLGLTLSRTLARRLHGDVRLDTSYVGPGARFVVNLPIMHSS